MSDGGIKWMVSVWAKYYVSLLDSTPEVLDSIDMEAQEFLELADRGDKNGPISIWLQMLLDFVSMARESDDREREFAKFFASVNDSDARGPVN